MSGQASRKQVNAILRRTAERAEKVSDLPSMADPPFACPPEQKQKFLVRRKGGAKTRAHLWVGNDTSCRMYSTGGLRPSRYVITETTDREICQMCRNVSER
jgi:hypothetical protein